MVTSWASGREFSGGFDGDWVAFSMVFCGMTKTMMVILMVMLMLMANFGGDFPVGCLMIFMGLLGWLMVIYGWEFQIYRDVMVICGDLRRFSGDLLCHMVPPKLGIFQGGVSDFNSWLYNCHWITLVILSPQALGFSHENDWVN